ncbi:OLC1v1028411C1 [Oldenlandia corymbosa var. corymbosa]|uniref:Glycosyltransferase n=1 Tax=Oldenlandia corymbosa var. corymbosa TaxID=529605 RepID=A0AAV1CBM9_OLDCO|nr:OLC1v1028411C1 [Oldenlandia corymbosa var. corymbosa]
MKAELVIIPFPVTGHLVSIVELAKLLIERDDHLSIKFLLFNLPFDPSAKSYIQSLLTETTKGIEYVQLSDPQPQDDPLMPQNPLALLYGIVESQKPQVRNFVAQLKKESSGSSKVTGFIVDTFCAAMIDVANEFELPTYVFYASGAAIIGLRYHLLSLVDENCDLSEYVDSDLQLPVSTYIHPVPAKQCPPEMFDADSPYLKMVRRWVGESKGIIVNTFLDLESYAIQALLRNQSLLAIYPVGPLINFRGISNNLENSETILRWLDDQPNSSVVFLCFGSFGSFELDQVKEIAKAVEQSGCRFLWSLRKARNKKLLEYPSEYDDYEEVLPEGFLDRTCGIGKVIGWAPQSLVLGHPAVGGFVTHCGWNSVLESVWFGVPMATWPMYAEQQLNAFLLVKDLGIAVEIRMNGNQGVVVVGADEIEGGIRKLMQLDGDIRARVKELKEKARNALSAGGSSQSSIGRLINDFRGSHD